MSLWNYYRQVAQSIAQSPLGKIQSRSDLDTHREALRREFLISAGLPEIPDFHPTEVVDHGTVQGKGFRMQRVSYPVLPDCWAAANIYHPDPLPDGDLPAVLYVIGHSPTGTHNAQRHGIMWARRGYICMTVDTIEQNDNPGMHRGLLTGPRSDWISLGYSSVGGEMWNSIRALDILEATQGVNADRIGVTGNSGGGGHSFFLAVADPRIRAVATSGGITQPQHLLECQQMMTHCACLTLINPFRNDPTAYATLIAPRPLLFVFGRGDYHFLPPSFRRMHADVQRIYAEYGKEDHCQLFEYEGPHGYTPDSVAAIQRWFDKHLAGEERTASALSEMELSESETSVFNGTPPQPNRLDMLPELLSRTGSVRLPDSPAEWPAIRAATVADIRGQLMPVFETTSEASFKPLWNWTKSTVQGLASYHRYTAEAGGHEMWLETLVPPEKTDYVFIGIADQNQIARNLLEKIMDRSQHSLAVFVPRFCGFNHCASQADLLLNAGAYTGMTPFMLMLEDLQRMIGKILDLPELKGMKPVLYGRGEAGIAALYHAILDERIDSLILEDIPNSHRKGAYFLNVLKLLDIQHALGLAAPRRISFLNAAPSLWAKRLYARLECTDRLQVAHSIKEVMQSYPRQAD